MPTKTNNQYGFANVELNGGKGSGNFGHSGRPGEVGGSGGRGALAEAESGHIGHFAGVEYVDEIYERSIQKVKDDFERLKAKKDKGDYIDMNDPARARLDSLKRDLSRAKELVGTNVPDAQAKKIESLEKEIKKIEELTKRDW